MREIERIIVTNIAISEKEALKMLKWRARRKAKKWKKRHDKKKAKNPKFAEAWDKFIDEVDRLLAGYNESQRQYFCMCATCHKIILYENATIDEKNDAYCSNCKNYNSEV